MSRLTRLVLLSLAAAVVTIALKTSAWLLTGSVGFLSDAAESLVNLVAALLALVVIQWAMRPADEEHAYGHAKAEYFSAGIEGALILLAAASIMWAAVGRLLAPAKVDQVGLGIAISVAASVVNLVVGRILVNAGRRYRSITLEANGRHVLTDVWTSAGVIIGVAAVALTGWDRLDPLIAMAVALNIIWTGLRLLRRSGGGLMDRALDEKERAALDAVLERLQQDQPVRFHAVRTRQAGQHAFVSLHVLVPGAWTVQRGHEFSERVEAELLAALPHALVFTHLEPLEDPASLTDIDLERPSAPVPHT